MNIWPWKPGDKGYLALPLEANIPEPKHTDWVLVKCPICGSECWESDLARIVKQQDGIIAVCTTCAIRAGKEEI
jgi:hypothetical protein